MITHIPFLLRKGLINNDIEGELYENIIREAKKYGKDAHDFSAKFELLPDPNGGHYLVAEVTYLKGDLTKLKPKK